MEAVVEWDAGDVLASDRVMFGYVTDTKYIIRAAKKLKLHSPTGILAIFPW